LRSLQTLKGPRQVGLGILRKARNAEGGGPLELAWVISSRGRGFRGGKKGHDRKTGGVVMTSFPGGTGQK